MQQSSRPFFAFIPVVCLQFSIWAPSAFGLETVPPYGDLPVGHASFIVMSWLDELTERSDDHRRLRVDVWYPAANHNAEQLPWASANMGGALAENFPFPAGFETDISTHTMKDAKPLAAPPPVLAFSHGLSFPPTLYQSLLEDLASRD